MPHGGAYLNNCLSSCPIMRPRVTSIGLIGAMPAADFAYPSHIDRDSVEALPPAPGVYRFLDQDGQSLYIGKSVHLRSRVLAHLRTPQEAAMLAQTARIDHVRTAGEIGALLLEAQLIRKEQPPYNCFLKEAGMVFSVQWRPGQAAPEIVGAADMAVSGDEGLFGLFVSRHAAWEGLRALLRRHRLCPAATGLEATVHARGCFSYQIGQCAGACVGKESHVEHAARLLAALRTLQENVWPFPGPIGILEESNGWRQTHVVDRWCYLGSLEGRRKKLKLRRAPFFDLDIYKILVRPLFLGHLNVVPLDLA